MILLFIKVILYRQTPGRARGQTALPLVGPAMAVISPRTPGPSLGPLTSLEGGRGIGAANKPPTPALPPFCPFTPWRGRPRRRGRPFCCSARPIPIGQKGQLYQTQSTSGSDVSDQSDLGGELIHFPAKVRLIQLTCCCVCIHNV